MIEIGRSISRLKTDALVDYIKLRILQVLYLAYFFFNRINVRHVSNLKSNFLLSKFCEERFRNFPKSG